MPYQLKKFRTLKIEERGDYAARQTVPSLRLKGKWLQAAGFPPGDHVTITCQSPGVLELRLNTLPPPDPHFQIAALRLDHAIAAAPSAKIN
jgi:hypothetical protein